MSILIKGAKIVNEDEIFTAHLLIEDERISKIMKDEIPAETKENTQIIDARGKILLPGMIDDQVHFREPGLTHKGNIASESAAAIAGGVTSYMEMPNTKPQTTTQDLLEEKFNLAEEKSFANYSFYLGATNTNMDEIIKTDPSSVCGVKVFMGSSTGNMLVDNFHSLNSIFKDCPVLITTHSEDEEIIKNNLAYYQKYYHQKIPVEAHPLIRNEEACYASSSKAVELAEKYGAQLHVLHLSTKRETKLFKKTDNYKEKKITAEVCVHHLWFDDSDYSKYGQKIKWNPAIKQKSNKEGLWEAIYNNQVDVIATDHAPHTASEKQLPPDPNSFDYTTCPSGGPLVQHSLPAMLEFYHQNKISLEKLVDKMCHKPAELFKIKNRGYIREGYQADMVLVDLTKKWDVTKESILYHCGWSPFENHSFRSKVTHTFINGHLVYENGQINPSPKGQKLLFDR